MQIDAHTHINLAGKGTEDVLRYMDEQGIDKAWLLGWEMQDGFDLGGYTHLSNQEVQRAAKEHPDRFIPFASVDPKRNDRSAYFKHWIEEGFRGLGEQKHRVCIDDPDQMELFQLAGEHQLPVLFHMDFPFRGISHWYNADIFRLEKVLQECPSTVFIGHAPGWWRFISAESGNWPQGITAATDLSRLDNDLVQQVLYPSGKVQPGGKVPELLEKYPNLYADISAGSGYKALTRDPDFTRTFVEKFWKKLLYGTDNGFDTGHLALVKGWNLPQERTDAVLGGNAQSLVPGK